MQALGLGIRVWSWVYKELRCLLVITPLEALSPDHQSQVGGPRSSKIAAGIACSCEQPRNASGGVSGSLEGQQRKLIMKRLCDEDADCGVTADFPCTGANQLLLSP